MKKFLIIKRLAINLGLLPLLFLVLPAVSGAANNMAECKQEAMEAGMIYAADIQNYVDQCMASLADPPVYDQEQPVEPEYNVEQQYNPEPEPEPEPEYNPEPVPEPEYDGGQGYGGVEPAENFLPDASLPDASLR